MSDVRPHVTQVPLARVYHMEDLEFLLILFAFLLLLRLKLSPVTIHHQNLADVTISCSPDFPVGA